MSILRKKKGDEDREEFKEISAKRRKIRDLKPKGERRRKEPPKPWGRRERLFVLIVILFTAGASGALALSARKWKLPGLPRITLPSFSFFGEKTVVITKEDKGKEKEAAEKVTSSFKGAVKELSGVYGLYVLNLGSGFAYGVNESDIFEPASLNKLPVMAAMYKEVEEGRVDLRSKYKLKTSDKVGGAGSLYGKPEGYEITYRDLISLMGKQSDNTAFNIAKNILGDEKINEVVDEIGMRDTVIFGEGQKTTPYDIGVFFEKLWVGDIVSKKSRDEILEALTDTIYEAWISEGIPQGVFVAHKFGREVHTVNDAGIVFADEPYVLVIMSKGVVEREADDIFPQLARMVHDSETQNSY